MRVLGGTCDQGLDIVLDGRLVERVDLVNGIIKTHINMVKKTKRLHLLIVTTVIINLHTCDMEPSMALLSDMSDVLQMSWPD